MEIKVYNYIDSEKQAAQKKAVKDAALEEFKLVFGQAMEEAESQFEAQTGLSMSEGSDSSRDTSNSKTDESSAALSAEESRMVTRGSIQEISTLSSSYSTSSAGILSANASTATSADEALGCPAEYDAYFEEASKTYNVDINLLKAMAKQESAYQSNATSKSGAMGIMQLMPSTAASLGVDNAYDPYQNIMGGAKFMSQLLAQFNGDISLALAGYNAGPNAVEKYNGIPPYEETQDYVVKITGYYEAAKAAETRSADATNINQEASNTTPQVTVTSGNITENSSAILHQKLYASIEEVLDLLKKTMEEENSDTTEVTEEESNLLI